MSILTGPEIIKRIEKGDIYIDNFDPNKVNPESYNLTLAPELLIYTTSILDSKKDNPTKKIIIPDDGYILMPGKLYLGMTNEYTETRNLHPMLDGRSSTARLGIQIHLTAGFGDNGFCGKWTLEFSVVQPVIIYPDMEICQIYYMELSGEPLIYKGKYQNSTDIGSSKLFKDFK